MPRATATFAKSEGLKLAPSGKALLCYMGDGVKEGKEVWIPLSVIDDDSEVSGEGDEGDLIVHEWFAIKEGLV